jgi:uncharacterized phage-associated protein
MPNIKELTTDEVLKLKAVVLYIINKCNEIDYFHLFKILYFADKEHYAKYGRRIIHDTFCALPKGPVPSFLFDAVKVATNQSTTNKSEKLNIIADSLYSSDPSYYFILSAKEAPDLEELSKSDIELLDKSIKENKDTNIESLSAKSHDEAWNNAWSKKSSHPIDPILMAKAAGANEDMIEYIKENELFNTLAY